MIVAYFSSSLYSWCIFQRICFVLCSTVDHFWGRVAKKVEGVEEANNNNGANDNIDKNVFLPPRLL